MTYETVLHAFLVTYLLSVLIFFLCVYLNLGERHERVLYTLLWPLYLCLLGIIVVLGLSLELLTSLLDLIWPDDGDETDPHYDQFNEDDDE